MEPALRALASALAAPMGCGEVIAIGVVEWSVFTRGLLTSEVAFVNWDIKKRLDKVFGFGYRSRAIEFSLWTDHAPSTEPQLHIFAHQSRDGCYGRRHRDCLYVPVDGAGRVLLHGLCALKSAAGLEPMTGT